MRFPLFLTLLAALAFVGCDSSDSDPDPDPDPEPEAPENVTGRWTGTWSNDIDTTFGGRRWTGNVGVRLVLSLADNAGTLTGNLDVDYIGRLIAREGGVPVDTLDYEIYATNTATVTGIYARPFIDIAMPANEPIRSLDLEARGNEATGLIPEFGFDDPWYYRRHGLPITFERAR